jgi:hypothetical protein
MYRSLNPFHADIRLVNFSNYLTQVIQSKWIAFQMTCLDHSTERLRQFNTGFKWKILNMEYKKLSIINSALIIILIHKNYRF